MDSKKQTLTREIKFKGLRTDGKGWVYGCLWEKPLVHGHHSMIYVEDGDEDVENTGWVHVIRESVGQFTGLKDKNGVDIYEGDIINWVWDSGKTEIEQVKHSLDWDGELSPSNAPFMSAWGSTCGKYFKTFMSIYDPTRYASVIGNIHEPINH